MHVQIVLAHPSANSLSHRFSDHLTQNLTARGHQTTLIDLYDIGFQPALTPEERAAYYSQPFADHSGLTQIDGLILIFPTWWFGLPAILKGWIDRTFLPGVTYHHAADGAALRPGLKNLKTVMAVTTMGSAAWYDRFVARRPVYKSLKWGTITPCAPRARFRMMTLHSAETLAPYRLSGFETKLTRAANQLFPTAA